MTPWLPSDPCCVRCSPFTSPYPALVVDGVWTLVDANASAAAPLTEGACLACPGDEVTARVVANSLRSALPLLERFGIATAAEVDVDTFGQRYAVELATSGAVHTLVPMVRAWTRTLTA
jgi:hypothetical protein